MSEEETGQRASMRHVVSLADVLKFKVELHKIAKCEENDLEMFTHYLDDAIRKKAYWRHDAIGQCLTLLDQMVLREDVWSIPKAPISRPSEAE